MSNDNSEKTGTIVGQSSTSGLRTGVEQPEEGSDETEVRTVSSQPRDDFASVFEDSVGLERNHSEFRHAPTSQLATSVVVPSAIRRFTPSVFPSQVVDNQYMYYDDRDVFPNRRSLEHCQFRHKSKNSFALVISGWDVANVRYARACLNDAFAIEEVLSGPNETIRPENTYRITPNENSTESEIEHIYSLITMKNPSRLVIFYSGHGSSMQINEPHPHLQVSRH